MCCLFGIVNYSGKKFPGADELTNALAQEATARGMDSTGIAYNKGGVLKIYKKPRNAYEMDFSGLDDCVVVTGHTRHATQGSYTKNYNNHPFYGCCENARFALAHNGVLWNDSFLRTRYDIPKDRIETDSYVAVQLLEHFNKLSVENVRKMAESVSGSFTFSMVDNTDTLWIVKGDSPLAIIHFPYMNLYAYASTQQILFTALCQTDLVHNISAGMFEMIPIECGEIVRIDKSGKIHRDKFHYYQSYYNCDWRTYTTPKTGDYWETDWEKQYLEDLKSVGRSMGYTDDDIDGLYRDGYTLDEIEDFLYCYN